MKYPHDPTRRELFKIGMATAAGGMSVLTPRPTARAATGRSVFNRDKPRHVIFMVVDGMSAGVPTLAEPFSHLTRDRGTNWVAMSNRADVVHGQMDNAVHDALVPDSAAASCAWATGRRIVNGMVNMLPDGQSLTPIGPLAKDAGRAVGLVTTTRITHATPAGFVAQVPRRGMEDEIAPQYLDVVDVLLGGGARHYDPDARSDRKNLLQQYADRGYELLRTRDELLASKALGKVLGLFTSSHLPYSIDRDNDQQLKRDVPTLAEMTRSALRRLNEHENGFLIQIEGGRVDHAAHSNDAGAIFPDQLAFDDALGVVLEFMKGRDDTLLIITSDHGNANPGLNGIGRGYGHSNDAFGRLTQFKGSFSTIRSGLRDVRRGTENDLPAHRRSVERVIREMTGVELNEDESTTLVSALQGRSVQEANAQHRNFNGQLGQMLGNRVGIQWTGVTHTADWVITMALGPGSDRFHGLVRNTDVYDHLTDMMGITHRNPHIKPEDADQPRRRGIGAMIDIDDPAHIA